ncbi:MAG: cupin domain-containing protein [Alphaproteobacteria bacterium]
MTATADRKAAVPTVQVDNALTRVTEWRFAPGASTGWHRHEYDYVVVPLLAGTLRLDEPGGTREVALQAGASYFRLAGLEHDVINAGTGEYAFIEIEFKAARR